MTVKKTLVTFETNTSFVMPPDYEKLLEEKLAEAKLKLEDAATMDSFAAEQDEDPEIPMPTSTDPNRGFLAAQRLRVAVREMSVVPNEGLLADLSNIDYAVGEIEAFRPMSRARVMPRVKRIRTHLDIARSRLGNNRVVVDRNELKEIRKLVQMLPTVPGLPSSDAEDRLTAIRYQLKMLKGEMTTEGMVLEAIKMIVNPTKMKYDKQTKEVVVDGM